MRDLYNNLEPVVAVSPGTISATGSPNSRTSGGIDLQGFDAALLVVHLGDIDELSGSPVGSAMLEVVVTDSADNSTFANVEDDDIVGADTVAAGVVATLTNDLRIARVSYVGGKRYIKVELRPTGLTNGGPVSAMVIKGRPGTAPVTASPTV